MTLIYPPVSDTTRTLKDVFSISAGDLYDTIYLGDIRLGWVATIVERNLDYWIFTPETNQENPFPARDSYGEVWQDILTLIANDMDLAVEFAIRVNNKVNS